MLDEKKMSLIVQVAQLYYENGLTQQEIAAALSISRPTICRLLNEAKQEGVVQININNPFEGRSRLEVELEKKFGLKKVIVIPNYNFREDQTKKRLGEKAAAYLHSIVRDGDIIALSWGTTLYEVALAIQKKRTRGIALVQCNGGVSRSNVNTHAAEIMERISRAINATSYLLPIPAIVDNRQVAEMLRRESQVRKALELQQSANIVLFSLGIPSSNSILVEAGYFTPQGMVNLQEKGAVGDIFSRYINIDGEICDYDLNARTIGMDLEHLRRDSVYSIAVAGGRAKARVIIGGCRGGYVKMLITDEAAAEEVLSIMS